MHAASGDVRKAASHGSTVVKNCASVRDDPDMLSTVDRDATCKSPAFAHGRGWPPRHLRCKNYRVTFASRAQRCDRPRLSCWRPRSCTGLRRVLGLGRSMRVAKLLDI